MTTFGLGLRARSVAALNDGVATAARAGYERVWLYDSGRCVEPFTAMAYVSAQSSALVVGVAVTNTVTRHPVVVANALATLTNLSGGRVICAVGRGDSAVRFLGRRPAPLGVLEQRFRTIRDLLHGESVTVNGRKYRLPEPPAEPPRLLLSAEGPKTCALAARVADGAIFSLAASPALLRQLVAELHGAAESAGRDSADLYVCGWLHGSIADTTAEAVAHATPEVGRTLLAGIRSARQLELAGLDEVDAATRDHLYRLATRQRDEYRLSHEIVSLLGSRVLHELTVTGNAAECREKVETLLGIAGVSELAFNMYGPPGTAARFAREVLAPLRASSPTSLALASHGQEGTP